MKTSLLIEMSVEACLLNEDEVVSMPLGKYSGLPWLAKTQAGDFDINFENAYLGEEVLSSPFQNKNSILRKGVHLHWIVPSFLGREYNGKMNAAPNRWLVNKNSQEQWIVVSDYVHYPEQQLIADKEHVRLEYNAKDDFSIFPTLEPADQSNQIPFFYLGKSFTIESKPSEPELRTNLFKTKFDEALTVLGFGSIQFSASYSDCKSVFGFHDPEGKMGDRYTITGWHADLEDDLVFNSIQVVKENPSFELTSFLDENFGVDLGKRKPKVPDAKTLYVAKIHIDNSASAPNKGKLKIAVGNTATEAFSALVADKMKGNGDDASWKKIEIEDQLEYMLMNDKMDGHLVDQIPKFIEARHQQGFSAHKGGTLYEFNENTVGKVEEFTGFPLSLVLHQGLNLLNKTKQRLFEAGNELASLKQQLYSDWYKYMRASYPPLGALDLFPDRDDIQHLVHVANLNTIKVKETEQSILQVRERELGWLLGNRYALELLKNLGDLNISSDHQKIGPEKLELIQKKLEGELEQLQAYLEPAFYLHPKINEMLARLIDSNDKRELDNLLTHLEPFLYSDPAVGDLDYVKKYLRPFSCLHPDVEEMLRGLKQEREEAGYRDLMTEILNRTPLNTSFLKEIPESPFWEPNEPVLVIDGFTFGQRNAQIKAKTGRVSWTGDVPNLPDERITMMKGTKMSLLGWCPFFMEWAAGLEDAPIDLIHSKKEAWAEKFRSNYYLDSDSPGVYRRKDAEVCGANDSYFQGGVILNPFMSSVFTEKMEKYIAFCDTLLATADILEKQNWQENKNLATNALERIQESDMLCQRLSGFNAACLMLRQVPQLKLKEPLGFTNSIAFSKTVADALTGQSLLSPTTLYNFLPIRNGKLILKALRFIDNFGRTTDFNNFEKLITADTLTSEELRKSLDNEDSDIEELSKEVFLPPRLVQPARLNLHFLEGYRERMTENLETSPVCGWFIPNFLDETIMVFAREGEALGFLEKSNGWNNLPWEDQTLTYESKIKDFYFRQVVEKIISIQEKETSYIDAFISALQSGLANVAPADFAMQNARVLLMGRPIAIVRLKAALQIKGYPALDQSWQSTLLDMKNSITTLDKTYLARKDRYTGNWNDIALPLRLGEYKQLNDGLLGYWVESNEGLSDPFYAPQTEKDESSFIISLNDSSNGERFVHDIRPDGAAIHFTALMDPRGILHATTGVLPTETLSIPQNSYQSALEKMYMWFKTGPVLHHQKMSVDEEGNARQVRFFNLPSIPDYQWSWSEDNNGVEQRMEIDKPSFDEIHEQLPELLNGYLILEKSAERT